MTKDFPSLAKLRQTYWSMRPAFKPMRRHLLVGQSVMPHTVVRAATNSIPAMRRFHEQLSACAAEQQSPLLNLWQERIADELTAYEGATSRALTVAAESAPQHAALYLAIYEAGARVFNSCVEAFDEAKLLLL